MFLEFSKTYVVALYPDASKLKIFVHWVSEVQSYQHGMHLRPAWHRHPQSWGLAPPHKWSCVTIGNKKLTPTPTLQKIIRNYW